jgi:uncharacterized repeat protein (TIGR03806 family)
LLSIGDGSIHKIVPEGSVQDDFPKLLSETGCFDASDPTEPTAGLIPFSVNAPLWSDGALKRRWMALPDGEQIHIEDDGDWTFPNGTVLVKSFEVNSRLVETRLLVRHDDGGWAGYAYEWNEAQTEATLLQAGKTLDVTGTPWKIPSRSDCSSCHTAAAGRSLGPETAQLNGDSVYPSTNRNSPQIATLVNIDMFDNPPSQSADDLPRLADIGDSAPAADRARAYLHSNCSHCHRPGGPGRSDADMRWFVPFANAGMCNISPESGDLGVAGARLVVPGDASRSMLPLRMRATDVTRMPALGTDIVHINGVGVIEDWIDSLSGCQ